MRNVSLKVLEKSLNFLFKNGYEPCIKLLTKLEVKAVRMLRLSLRLLMLSLRIADKSLGTFTTHGWLASLSLFRRRSGCSRIYLTRLTQVVQYLTRTSNLSGRLKQCCLFCWGLGLLFVWLSYFFYRQLCESFSEVLFDPISQQSRPQGVLGKSPRDVVGYPSCSVGHFRVP